MTFGKWHSLVTFRLNSFQGSLSRMTNLIVKITQLNGTLRKTHLKAEISVGGKLCVDRKKMHDLTKE